MSNDLFTQYSWNTMMPIMEMDPSKTAILIWLLFTKVKVHKMNGANIKKAALFEKTAFTTEYLLVYLLITKRPVFKRFPFVKVL